MTLGENGSILDLSVPGTEDRDNGKVDLDAAAMEDFVKRLSVLLLLIALLPGCSRNEMQAPPPAKKAERTSLRIGLIPEQNIFKQLERYQPLARYLSRKTGAGVELRILTRYGNIIDNFRSAKLDGAFFGSFTYALAHRKLGVEVLARPVAPDNASTYHGLIFVRKDSGIRDLAGMEGKRFVFVDKATTAGYLLPIEYFHGGGVDDSKIYFRETYFSGTHEGAILDVLDGMVRRFADDVMGSLKTGYRMEADRAKSDGKANPLATDTVPILRDIVSSKVGGYAASGI